MTTLSFVVRGRPTPQGSKKAWAYTGKDGKARAMLQESSAAGLKAWRAAVVEAARMACAKLDAEQGEPLPTIPFPTGVPVSLNASFWFTRPKSHYRTGKSAHLLRDDAPARPVNRATGDLSKLIRGLEDALTDAGVWADDSQVASITASSHYIEHGMWTREGAVVSIVEASQ